MNAEEEFTIAAEDIAKIFKCQVNPEKGAEILKTLQKHRVEGTLDYEMSFPKPMISKGLAYLRAVNPIDEDAAIIARIDRETSRTPQTNSELSPHAISQIELLKQRNEERYILQAAENDAESKAKSDVKGPVQTKNVKVKSHQSTAPSNELVGLRPEPEWVSRYRENATNHSYEKTKIPKWAKLMPSAGLTITVVVASLLFVQIYTPVPRNARLWPEIPPAAATVITLIGINVLVYLLWRVPLMWKFMNQNFLVAPVYPYAMSMLGASFSHHHIGHLLGNMVALWLIGTRLHDDIGRGPFLGAYFTSAVVAAYVPMAVYIFRNVLTTTTLGASGAVCGLIGTYFVLHEGLPVVLPFLPLEWTRRVDTGVLLAVAMLFEIRSIRKGGINPGLTRTLPSDHMGHLTGYAVGLGAGTIIRSVDPKWRNIERQHILTQKNHTARKSSPSEKP